jgi:plasmid stabilization system protein ParE
MKRKLLVRPRVNLDREQHCLYFFDHAPHLVDAFDRAVRGAIKRIGESPRGHPTLVGPRLPDAELRFARPGQFKSHLIIYQVTDDSVIILRILHGSQDIEAALKP